MHKSDLLVVVMSVREDIPMRREQIHLTLGWMGEGSVKFRILINSSLSRLRMRQICISSLFLIFLSYTLRSKSRGDSHLSSVLGKSLFLYVFSVFQAKAMNTDGGG
jgi:hypothetical protein